MSAGKEAGDFTEKSPLWQPSIGQHQTDPLRPPESAMEINNHFQHITQKDIPSMYMRSPLVNNVVSNEALEAQLVDLGKHYRLQEEMLNRQFEEQRQLLAHEQHIKMQEYLKMMMVQKQQEFLEQQKKLEDQRIENERKEKDRIEKLHLLKNKNKDEESAVASNEVKLKLRECLLNKGPRDPLSKNSPPDFRQWATQHSSLEQHSPPTSGLSPPLQGPHMLGRYESEYPLRKTVSEPNLKMKSSKKSLRQIVMQRNSPLVNRRDFLKKKVPLTTSEPNLKVRLALKQKMIERRSSPLLRRKERFVKRNPTTPLTIDTTMCNSNPDSGPNSPPSSSQGSSAEGLPPTKDGETTAFPLQLMSKMVINQSMPNISIGQPRGDKLPKPDFSTNLSMSASEAELRAQAAHYGFPLLTGSLQFYPHQGVGEGEMSPTNSALMEAQMKALELARSTGQLPISPLVIGMPQGSNAPSVAEVQAANAQARLQRTQSAPLPLPGAQLWNYQMLLQKQHEQLLKENQKHYLKQKLQSTLLQRVGSKNHMENVDEAAETRLAQEMKEIREKEDNDVMVIHEEKSPLEQTHSSVRPHSKDREAFFLKMRQRTISGGSPPITAGIPRAPVLERAQSSPTMNVARKMATSSPTTEQAPDGVFKTGIAYDPLMLKHGCLCGSNIGHPEHPGRLQSIWARLQETGLVSQCERIKSRKATLDELQTCHSEAYVAMYGSSQTKVDQLILENFASRFTKLGCGGIGVDSDTTWHELYTPQAARMAAGCVIELAFKVASKQLENGFAVVRPPGHHAEDTQAMGFCYFNSIAVAAKLLLDRLRLKKILIVDWDVHHGNSTQQLFYTDPRVLYISLHRHDNGNFFPGTGAPADCGIDRGTGFNVNIAWSGPLTHPMSDAEYMMAFRTIVMPIAREFKPEVVLVSAGFDAAVGHPAPLGGYKLSPACFGHMTKQLLTLADGHVALVLEGGYELQPICDSSEMCLRALLGEEIPFLSEEEMCRAPNAAAVETLQTTMKVQAGYWPVVTRYEQSLRWSLIEARQRDRDEADTVSAFASLSMAHAKHSSLTSQDSTSTTGTGDDIEQPMEES